MAQKGSINFVLNLLGLVNKSQNQNSMCLNDDLVSGRNANEGLSSLIIIQAAQGSHQSGPVLCRVHFSHIPAHTV